MGDGADVLCDWPAPAETGTFMVCAFSPDGCRQFHFNNIPTLAAVNAACRTHLCIPERIAFFPAGGKAREVFARRRVGLERRWPAPPRDMTMSTVRVDADGAIEMRRPPRPSL